MQPYLTQAIALQQVKDYLLSQETQITQMVSILSSIDDEVEYTGELYECLNGIINYDNLSASQINLLLNDGKDIGYEGPVAISVFLNNILYDGTGTWITISQALELEEGDTITDKIGAPWMSYIANHSASTLADAISAAFNFQDTTCSGTVSIRINNVVYPLFDVSINSSTHTTTVTRWYSQSSGVLSKTLAACAYSLEMIELYKIASKVGNDDHGVISAISRFNSSGWASVREFTRDLTNAALNGPMSIASFICSKFQNKYEFTINDDGTVEWGESDVHTTDYTPWAVVKGSIGPLMTTIGTVLMVTTGILGKILGAVLSIGANILTTFTDIAASSSAVGFVPTINVNADEATYCDYVFYHKYQHIDSDETDAYEMFDLSDSMITLSSLLTADAYNMLLRNRSLTISTAFWVIYIYNYESSGSDESYEVKIFPTVCCGDDVYQGTYGKIFNITNAGAYLPEGYFNIKDGFDTAGDSTNAIGSPYYTYNGGLNASPIDPTSLCDFLKYSYDRMSLRDPSCLISSSLNYEDWDVLSRSLCSSINAILIAGGAFGSFTNSNDKIDGSACNGFGCLWNNGQLFSGGLSGYIAAMRYFSNWRLFPALVLLTKSSEITSVSTLNHYRYIETNTNTTHRFQNVAIQKLESAHYPINFSNLIPMAVPPARSLIATLVGVGIAAGATFALIAGIKSVTKKMSRWKSYKRQMKINDFKEQLSHFDLNSEEFSQLDREDQKEYKSEYNKLVRRIDRFNAFGSMFGLTTLDIRNDWVEVPDTSAVSVTDGTSGLFTNIEKLLEDSEANNSALDATDIRGSTQLRLLDEVSPSDVSLVDIFNALVSFSQPQNNL